MITSARGTRSMRRMNTGMLGQEVMMEIDVIKRKDGKMVMMMMMV